MRHARIYKPAKSASQSGLARTKYWVLEFSPQSSYFTDPTTGWNGSKDTQRQVRLTFPSLERAKSYAEKNNLNICIEDPTTQVFIPKKYADNFDYSRVRE